MNELCIVSVLLLCSKIDAANILGLMGVPSPSHHIWNKSIYEELAKLGHNLTIFSPDIEEDTDGIHYIKAEGVYEALYSSEENSRSFLIDTATKSPASAIVTSWNFCTNVCDLILKSEGFKRLLNYPGSFKFDLVLFDFAAGPCTLGFLHKFGYPPTVALTAYGLPHFTYDFVKGHRQPSYLAYWNLNYDDMNFFQRIHNYAIYLLDDLYRFVYVYPMQWWLMYNAFGYSDLPWPRDLSEHCGLALVNVHYAVEPIEPLPSNIIPVGGLHIQEPSPLPDDLLQFISKSKSGVVIFSLGTNIKAHMLGEEKIQAFLSAFEKFSAFGFVWKFETSEILAYNIPKNVKIVQHLKQNDFLAHPRVAAFISHCGLLGAQEAIYHGIPVIGIPFFTDQHKNIKSLETFGMAVRIPFTNITEESIVAALHEVLHDRSYRDYGKQQSIMFRDQPEKPLDRAIFWIKWMLRHTHNYRKVELKTGGMGTFATNAYDILLFLIFGIALFLVMIVKLRQFFKRKSTNVKSIKRKRK